MRNQKGQNAGGRRGRDGSSTTMVRAEAPSLHMECETESLSQVQIDKALRIKNELAKLHNLNFNMPNMPVGASLVNGTGTALTNGTSNVVPRFLLLQNGETIAQSTTMATASQSRSQSARAQSSPSPSSRPVRSTRVINSRAAASVTPPSLPRSPPVMRGGGPASRTNNSSSNNSGSDIQVIGQKRSTAPSPAPAANNVSNNTTSGGPNNKFFPLLYVVPRPKNTLPAPQATQQRKDLDMKVKAILVKTPQELVEYLLQEGLVRTSQSCQVHKQPMSNTPMKLKLGMFSDPKVLSTSGGYVWISDCCGKKYVSVYSGSIFGSTPIDKVPPSSVLKLVYHWSCQTSIQNVENWVKVDKMFINKMYQYNRCICSVILQDKVFDFGIGGQTVELGIVSLGTSTADGAKKAVKVEILGLYDREMKCYRLFASEPEPGSNSRQRFMRILKPMERVVHRNAIILCDQSVDRNCLYSLSFVKVSVCDASDNEDNLHSNGRIMSYLRRHVPKMFQSTLSQLSLEQVQVVLDELCWREKYGLSASQAFTSLIEHIHFLTTREAENPGVLHLLDSVSSSPLQNYSMKGSQSIPARPQFPTPRPSIIAGPPDATMRQNIQNMMTAITAPSARTQGGRMANVKSPAPQKAGMLPAATEQNVVQMEPFYYAQIQGTPVPKDPAEEIMEEFVCHICRDSYVNNVEYYTHMKKHVTYPDRIPDGVHVCKYCTEIFETEEKRIYHMKFNHMLADVNQRWCRICCESMSTDHQLVTHMTKKHQESEMPYRCEICNFSTSFYFSLIDHFDKEHSGGQQVQCHYCLVTKVASAKGASTFSLRVFQHMQKHRSQTGKCKNCVLTFYSKYLWEEHKKKEHVSRANTLGLQRYKLPAGARAIHFRPPPKKIEYNTSGAAASVPSSFNQNSYYTLKTHEKLVINAVDEDDDEEGRSFYCIECDGNIQLDGHYKTYQKCIKCPYATCCRNMMVKHVAVFHPTRGKKIPYRIGPAMKLTNSMYCVCGFSTHSGNHLARHLAKCEGGRYSAYPSMSAARPGGYAPMVSMPSAPAFDMSHFLSQTMDVEDDADEPMSMPLSVEIDD